jgi:hypothetical protein
MVIAGKYVIQPDGAAETNQIEIKGMNGASPMPIVTTTFERGASSISQTATVTSPNGGRIAALSMVKRDIKFGLIEVLRSQVATYEQRDQKGNRVCGAKVHLTWQPLVAQQVLKDKYRRCDAYLSPGRVVPGHAQHQVDHLRIQPSGSDGGRVGPSQTDQLAVPAQQRRRGDQEDLPPVPRQRLRQHGQDHPIAWRVARPGRYS